MTTSLSIICAMDQNRLIGNNNELPWHLPADLAFFKRTTLGKPVLMGRKTYESIGRPLPGRQNIIITRDRDYQVDGCDSCQSIDAALELAADQEEIMLIGGASLYQQTLDRAQKLYLTRIHTSFEGDAWFPEFDPEDWLEDWHEDHYSDEKNKYDFSFIQYSRK
jgi:dihydrofolate reductase